ncbi:hypothetical protein COU54_00605 [Candidatus Pacearchaeota archaeon CG10_big_fil_rev_8_21_14_0_10_31_24]|nr:MAG: hypothetical protein COU54_00605 [Candidatus Pacearchaeota archaeon CG10_big_fil_rev_8_21_14_0_10_31_24]
MNSNAKLKKQIPDLNTIVEKKKKGFAKFLKKERELGGGSILGNGLNGSYSDSDLKCFDSQDLKNKLSKKYNQKVELDLE